MIFCLLLVPMRASLKELMHLEQEEEEAMTMKRPISTTTMTWKVWLASLSTGSTVSQVQGQKKKWSFLHMHARKGTNPTSFTYLTHILLQLDTAAFTMLQVSSNVSLATNGSVVLVVIPPPHILSITWSAPGTRKFSYILPLHSVIPFSSAIVVVLRMSSPWVSFLQNPIPLSSYCAVPHALPCLLQRI